METALILGLLVAFLYREIFGLSPGGLVVPGYIGFFLLQPEPIVMTLCFSFLTLLGLKLLNRFTLCYGRRRFFVAIILGALLPPLAAALFSVAVFSPGASIGIIIPGLIALDLDKQGVITTLLALFPAALLVRLLLELFLRVGLL